MNPRGPHHRGFTLVEMLFAMTIGSVILLAAITVLRSTGDGYERLGGGVGAEREARALLGQLQADLGGAVFHKDILLKKSTEKWPVDHIGFPTLQPADAQLKDNRVGDLCAVRYYVKDEIIGGKTVRCLMRGFVESRETFKQLKQDALGKLFEESAPGGSGAETGADEAIAFGVVSFEARPMTREKSGRLSEWKTSKDTPPDVMNLRLVLARRDLAAKLNNAADWNGNGAVASLMGRPTDAVKNKNFQVYETTVRFGHPIGDDEKEK